MTRPVTVRATAETAFPARRGFGGGRPGDARTVGVGLEATFEFRLFVRSCVLDFARGRGPAPLGPWKRASGDPGRCFGRSNALSCV